MLIGLVYSAPLRTARTTRLAVGSGRALGSRAAALILQSPDPHVPFSTTPMPKTAYYAVSAGRKPGIYHTWSEAEAQVKGFGGAKFKKFPTEAGAVAFMKAGNAPYDALSSRAGSSGGSAPKAESSKRADANGSSSKNSGSKTKTRAESPPTSAIPSSLPPELAKLAQKGYTFSRSTPHRLVVYTDGSGIGNGKRGAVAGAGVFWGGTGEAYAHNLAERVPGLMQTNNRGELLSIIRALETCPYPDLPLEIRTDSQYSISCMTVYIHKWIQNGWRTGGSKGKYGNKASGESVKNADMIRHLLVLLRRRGPTASVRFKYVRGHAGHEGNEAADKLARMGAMCPPLPDRTDWLDPDTEAQVARKEGADVEVVGAGKDEEYDVEVDPDWLMDADELAELETDLADK